MKGRVVDDLAIVFHERDTVATAIDALETGMVLSLEPRTVTVREPIGFGHKLATVSIDPDAPIYKYGEQIGRATRPIQPGEWVHTHNCASTRGRGDLDGEGDR